MLAGKRITVPLQIALERHEDLPDIPTIMELPGDPRRGAALKLIVSRQAMARPFAAPQGVAPERIEALRAAFERPCAIPIFSPRCAASASRCGRSAAPKYKA